MPYEYAIRSGTHTCGHCRGRGTIGFWFWKRPCTLCDGAGKIFVANEQVVWPMGGEKARSPIRREGATDVEAIPPDARPYMHDRPRRPPRR